MKKIFSTLLLLVLIISCSNPSGTAIVMDDDELTLNAKKLLKSYIDNDFTLWEELFSDDCEVRFNNTVTDKTNLIAGIKQDHILFETMVTSDEYAHTNYFNNGQVWTNHWFVNTATGNYTKETTSAKAHTDLKWEDGKVVIFQVYYDPAFQIKEANAMSLATN